MTQGKYGYCCHSSHCADIIPELTEERKLDTSAGGLYRLKKGIMRYFAAPGKMDRYDVEIQFSDGEIWEVDAKAYRNSISLRAKIQHDNGFPEGEYTRGYFVVPSEYTVNQRNYTSIINRAL